MVDMSCDEEGNAHYQDWSEACVRNPGGLTFWTVFVVAEKIRGSAPADAEGRENAQVGIRFVSEYEYPPVKMPS